MIEISRFIDEKEAWSKVYSRQDAICLDLDKARIFCSIESYNNDGGGGTSILTGLKDQPILTAIVYRDTANYTILQLIENQNEINLLKELN